MDAQDRQLVDRQSHDHGALNRKVCLSLGSNIDPADNLNAAVELLREQMTVLAVSRAWRTPAVGMHGPDFLNAAALVFTSYSLDALKKEVLRKIEARLGRVRTEDKFVPRTIDIDIVACEEQILDHSLWIYPHLALPVSELLPELTEPVSGKRLEQVARQLAHESGISPCPDILECI
jgi:2-amino-4-hydroxy-6-hydroxymethyldihydropteridine diphosphokinase